MIELFDLGGTIAAHYGCNKEVLMYIPQFAFNFPCLE